VFRRGNLKKAPKKGKPHKGGPLENLTQKPYRRKIVNDTKEDIENNSKWEP